MPENKFDINTFVQDLFALPSTNGMDYYVVDAIYSLIEGKKNSKHEETFETNAKKHPEMQGLWRKYEEYDKDPKSPESVEFSEFFKFIYPLFDISRTNTDGISMILRKIDVFDKKTQLAILKKINSKDAFSSGQVHKNILAAIAGNEFATTRDKVDVAKEIGATNINIVRDAVEALKNDLQTEIGKKFPDTEAIHEICDMGNAVYKQVRTKMINARTDATGELERYLEEIKEYFVFGKIIEFGFNYVANVKESIEERAVKAERDLRDAKDTIASNNRKIEQIQEQLELEKQRADNATKDFNRVTKERDEYFDKNTYMESKIKMLSSQLDDLQKQVDRYEDKTRQIREAALKIKGGLFGGKKIEELRQMVK